MSIARVSTGTVAGGSTSVAPAPAVAPNAGELAVLKVTTKRDDTTINTPTGYTAFPGTNGIGGITGAIDDTGKDRAAMFYRVCDGSEGTNTVTVSITLGNASLGQIDVYSATNGWDTASFAGTTGDDNTSGTDWSATGGSNLSLNNGDRLVIIGSCSSNTSTSITSKAVSATGATFGAAANSTTRNTNTGNDLLMDLVDFPVTGGPSSAAPVYTATHGAANDGVTSFAKLVEATVRQMNPGTPVDELEEALGFTVVKNIAVSLVDELEEALAVAFKRIIAVGIADEVEDIPTDTRITGSGLRIRAGRQAGYLTNWRKG